jgi:hypothetical protein
MMKRREFITLLGGAAAWPMTARAQQPALPIIAFINAGAAETNTRIVAAFRKGLDEIGYVDGQNLTVEYHWLERSPAGADGRSGPPPCGGDRRAQHDAGRGRGQSRDAKDPDCFRYRR